MNPYDVLGVSPGATLVEIKAQYRDLMKQHHPDHGGTVEGFVKIRRAYEVLMGLRSQSKLCERCKGTGQIEVGGSSFVDIKMLCPQCRRNK